MGEKTTLEKAHIMHQQVLIVLAETTSKPALPLLRGRRPLLLLGLQRLSLLRLRLLRLLRRLSP
jgi:hypothetical protein